MYCYNLHYVSSQRITDLKMESAADLVAEIERRIVAGELLPGARLDPVRIAAQNLALAPNTVAAAYRTLAERGMVTGRGRKGTFVETPTRTHTHLVPEVPVGATDLASGLPDPRLLPDLGPYLAALGGSQTTYGDPSVAPELASSVGSLLATEGLPTHSMAVTGGAVDAVERALATHVRSGDLVAVEDPGWFAIVDLIRTMGLRPVPIPVDREGMVVSALAAVVNDLAAVVITPRAQNPTGIVTSLRRADELASLLESRPRVLVVEDDHLGPVGGGTLAAVGPRLERWAFVRSFSKALGPDLRVATVVGDDLTIGRLVGRQIVGPGWVSHILQRTVAALLASPGFATLEENARAAYAQRRELMIGALDRFGLESYGQTGLNVWVPVPDVDLAVREALDRGYAIRSGERFRHQAEPGVRITISMVDESAADAVANALATEPGIGKSRAV